MKGQKDGGRTNKQMDGKKARQTNGQMDGQTEGRTEVQRTDCCTNLWNILDECYTNFYI